MSAGGFVRRGFYTGGYVRRGFCPRFLINNVAEALKWAAQLKIVHVKQRTRCAILTFREC